jgi:uncharacterized protein (TIGR02453 family)
MRLDVRAGRHPDAGTGCEDRRMTEFEGFGPEVQRWFRGLAADNSKAYFDAHREVFEDAIRDQMAALLAELSETFGGEVKLFRPNRDVRFSRDKSPYKTNTYGVLRGPEIGAGGLYASISADMLVAGSGYYMMARDQLDRYREHVADDSDGPALSAAVLAAERAGLELWGETLATAPRGYPREHPRIGLLRRKSLALGARVPFGRGIGREEGLRFVSGTWQAAAPATAWLDQHVGPSTLPDDRRRRRR